MRYWPLSIIVNSPLMPWEFAGELYNVQVRHKDDCLSHRAVHACGEVAMNTPARELEQLAVIETVNGAAQNVFKDYPSLDEWTAIERTCIVQGPDGMLHIMMNALH